MVDGLHQPVAGWCHKVPSGGPSPEKEARRELLEKVDGKADDMCYVGQTYTSNGISDDVAYVYLATGITLGAHREPTKRSAELSEG